MLCSQGPGTSAGILQEFRCEVCGLVTTNPIHWFVIRCGDSELTVCRWNSETAKMNPSKLVREMLEVTGLASVLHISSVDDLIEIFCTSDRAIENMHRAVG
jgi:hypothetical protein